MKPEVAVLDDLKARKMARKLRIKIVDTLCILKTLMDMDLLQENPEDLRLQLKDQGFWIDHRLCITH